MDATVSATRLIPAVAVPEGAGVTVYRTIGTPALRNYDPFLLLDHISSDNPDDYAAGFPSHPHRGFNTFTYMIDGHMEHQDSMGNTGDLAPGSAQWMKAASGIIHSEMPKQENGLMRGFQLWINLPAANKMDQPEYQEYAAEAFPVVETADYTLKVLIGRFADAVHPLLMRLPTSCIWMCMCSPANIFSITCRWSIPAFCMRSRVVDKLRGETCRSIHWLYWVLMTVYLILLREKKVRG